LLPAVTVQGLSSGTVSPDGGVPPLANFFACLHSKLLANEG